MRRGTEQYVSVSDHARGLPARHGQFDPGPFDQSPFNQAALQPATATPAQHGDDERALIARFFIDLRQALQFTVPQAAHYLAVHPQLIEALETGRVEYLPDWEETSGIIMTYTSMAGINGRPVLSALGHLLRHLSAAAAPPAVQQAPVQPQHHVPFANRVESYGRQAPHPAPANWAHQAASPAQPYAAQFSSYVQPAYGHQGYDGSPYAQAPLPARARTPEPAALPSPSALAVSSRNLMRAGSAIANGARRLPQVAMTQVRARPQRALYALSLPLGILIVLMHSSILSSISHPFSRVVGWASGYFQEHFGPVKDGLRYIEVDDPRSRRGDKLRMTSGSY
jgi:hypothetical protein